MYFVAHFLSFIELKNAFYRHFILTKVSISDIFLFIVYYKCYVIQFIKNFHFDIRIAQKELQNDLVKRRNDAESRA